MAIKSRIINEEELDLLEVVGVPLMNKHTLPDGRIEVEFEEEHEQEVNETLSKEED